MQVDIRVYTTFNHIMTRKKKIDKNYFAIADLVEQTIRELAETLLVTKADLKYLPTKAEFYKSMDKIMSELQTMREESTVSTDLKRQLNNHEDRLETVEEKIGIQAVV